MHCIFLATHWLLHFDGVKLLLEASLLQVSHEDGQVVSGSSKRLYLSGLARLLTLQHFITRDVVIIISSSLVN